METNFFREVLGDHFKSFLALEKSPLSSDISLGLKKYSSIKMICFLYQSQYLSL